MLRKDTVCDKRQRDVFFKQSYSTLGIYKAGKISLLGQLGQKTEKMEVRGYDLKGLQTNAEFTAM